MNAFNDSPCFDLGLRNATDARGALVVHILRGVNTVRSEIERPTLD